MATKFSQFADGGILRINDIVVGLRSSVNTKMTMETGLKDANGNPFLGFTAVTDATNYITFTNAIAGGAPIIAVNGFLPDVPLAITTLGAGNITLTPGTSGEVIIPAFTSIQVPAGTTAQRPVPGVAGKFRYNTDTDYLEYWDDGLSAWVLIIAGAAIDTATFVTNTDETADLPNSQPLSALTTGIAYVTTTTGIVGTRTLTGTANQIDIANGTGSGGNPTFSTPTTFIAPGTIQATTSSAATSFLLHGSSSGTISILPQANAGTFNFNMPITAGTAGFLLTSAGGGGSAMTWSDPAVVGGVNSVSGTANRITVSPTTGAVNVDIAATYVGQTSITTVGALSTGSLVAGFTPVTVPIGGTGNTTFTAFSVITAGTTATGAFQNVSGVGTSGQVLTSTGPASLPTWQSITNSSGTLSLSINQVAHGFSVGQVVYLNGATYTLAEANAISTSEVIGIVLTVTDADNFVLLIEGHITGLSGLSAGTVYFLSDSVAGALSATEPTTVGYVSAPLLVADSTTAGYFHRYRGKVIPIFAGWVDQTTTPVTLAVGTQYVADNAGLVTFNMPATVAFGSVIEVAGQGAGGWLIRFNTGQIGHLNSSATSSAGSFASTNRYDSIRLVCTVANTTFVALSSSGVITNA